MGKIYADSLEDPVSAMAVLGDFCFLAGKCNREFVLYHPGQDMRDFMIMVPQDKDWADLIEECYGEKAKRVARYAIKKEKDVFDREALQKAVDELPGGYTLKMIDEKLFWHCRKIAWCRDWVLQYEDYAAYRKYMRGEVDSGVFEEGVVSQLGCAESMVSCAG